MLKELNDHLLSIAPTIASPEIAIECHPGYLSEHDWQQLTACGFTRYSIGIQDMKEEVLKAVNRRPSLLPLQEILQILRASGATVNFDFIYGLPLQSVDSFRKTTNRLQRCALTVWSHSPMPIYPNSSPVSRYSIVWACLRRKRKTGCMRQPRRY